MKIDGKKIALLSLLAVGVLVMAEPALAQSTGSSISIKSNGQSVGDVAGNITNSLRGVSILLTMCCYLGALVFGFIGALKWKAYGEQPDRTPFKIPVTYWGIAVLLAGFPEFLGTGVSTLWGTGTVDIVNQP